MVEKRDEVYIDPNFFLPPNVLDIRYVDKDVPEQDTTVEGTDSESITDTTFPETMDGSPQPDSTPEEQSLLPIPDGLTVVSQTVKAAAGGGYLVDIVIDIPDLPGVENFDVAVTKA